MGIFRKRERDQILIGRNKNLHREWEGKPEQMKQNEREENRKIETDGERG